MEVKFYGRKKEKPSKKKIDKEPLKNGLKELFDLYITRKLEDDDFIVEFKIKRKIKKE